MSVLNEPVRAPPPALVKGLGRVLRPIVSALLWTGVALVLSLGSAYLLLRHVLWPDIDRWRPQIERLVSRLADAPVSIGELQSGFDGLRPSLRARAIRVGEGEHSPLAIEEAFAVISLSSLLRGMPSLVQLEIERPVVRVERIDRRRFAVAGALVDLDRPGRSAELAMVLASRSVSVRNARFDWRDRLGSEPMLIAGVDLHSASDADHHHLSLRAPALGPGVQGLELALDFKSRAGSDPTDWRSWSGQGYASADQVQFAPLARTLLGWFEPTAVAQTMVVAGSGPIKAWVRFDQGSIVEVFGKTFTESIDIATGGKRLALRSLTLEASAQPLGAGVLAVTPRRLSAVDSEGFAFALDEGLSQRIELETASLRARSGDLTLRGFDAARLLDTARRLPFEASWRAPLSRLSLGGRITSAGLRWDLERESYSVSLRFDRLSARRVPERGSRLPDAWPSFANLSGSVEFDDRSGRLQLDSNGAVLRFPGVFADPVLQFTALRGDLSWELDPSAPAGVARLSQLKAGSLSVANADLAGELSGVWRAQASSPLGALELDGKLDRVQAARVARYLPLAVNASTRAWVARAVGTGAASRASVALRGDLADFPFRNPALGEFRIEARVDQLMLAHTPGWPAIEKIRGGLLFERAAMTVQAESAEMSGMRIGPVQARIDDFARPLLMIEGEALGATQQMLRAIEQTPLRSRVAGPLIGWQVDGEARLALGLEIGLSRGGGADWRGTLDLSNNRIRMSDELPVLESVSGKVGFDPSGVRSRDFITATLLGGASRWQVSVPSTGASLVDARGELDAARLGAALGPRWQEALSGALNWQAVFRIDDAQWRGRIESDLRTVDVRLPQPLGKSAGRAWPLMIDIERALLDRRGTTMLSMALGREAQARFERPAGTPTWRGALAVGTSPQLPASGLSVDLRVPAFDADAWRGWLDQAVPAGGAPAAAWPVVDRLTLITPALTVGGKTLTQVALGASLGEGRWRASLASAEVEGFLQWLPPSDQAPAGALSGKLALLSIARGQQQEIEAILDSPPKRLPALDIVAERLVLAERELGRLSLLAENANDGEHPTWRLQRLKVEHPGGTLDAQGIWESGAVGRRTTMLDFKLDMRDPSRVLDTFGIRGALSGGAPARLGGKLRWRGSPLALDYPSLAGEVDIQVGKGQFLKTEPGLGKLIGVLNLQSLPRRLSLDFRDVFSEGFSFDDIRGRASIESGVARTNDFRMRGVQAQVQIRGEANLAGETQRLRVEVRPELNAGLASLAYAAMANPAIGLGSFIAQWALRKPLQEMFSYEYDVVGSWTDPTVTERARPRFEAMAEELKKPVTPARPPADGRAPPTAPR